ncbi:pheST operon leader peptide PheM [Yersinia enterocolitica]
MLHAVTFRFFFYFSA